MVPRTGVSGGFSVTINDVMDMNHMVNGVLRWIYAWHRWQDQWSGDLGE